MKSIILISCVGKKLNSKSKAKDLYITPLFKYSLQYAYKLQKEANGEIYILSAKYGLLDLDEEILPYNLSLRNYNSDKRKIRSKYIIKQLQEKGYAKDTKIYFLAGENYTKYLKLYYKNHIDILQGLIIGKRMQLLRNKLKEDK